MALLYACIGAVIGSFLALVADRWPRGEDVVITPSHCRGCQARLAPHELIPLLSYAWLRGRCRRCAAPIPPDCVFAEAGGVAVALIVAAKTASLGAALAWGGFGAVLVLLALLDARALWLPDALTLPLMAAGLIAGPGVLALYPGPAPIDRAAGALLGFAVLEALRRGWLRATGRDALGGGDPKLLGAIGAWLGWQALPGVVLASALGGLGWAGIEAWRGRPAGGDTPVPLGTALALAALLALALG